MTEVEFALSQDKEKDCIELIGTILWNKADKHKNFETLSLPEKTFIYIAIFESELKNGGLFAYLYNASGQYSHECLEAYKTIHAFKTFTFIDKAIRLFPELPIPKDILIRRAFIANLEDYVLNSWEEITEQLGASNEDIVSLLLAYVVANKTSFAY